VRLGAFVKGETHGQLIIILASEVTTGLFDVSENKQDELQTLRPAYALIESTQNSASLFVI
jgi:hypothetical protein